MGRLSTRRIVLAVAAFVVLHALALPPFAIWPLAFLSLTPLLFALQGQRPLARARIGFLAGVAVSGATVVAPLFTALTAYFEFSGVTSLGVSFVIAVLFGGGGFALFTLLAGDPRRDGSLTVPRVALALVASELYRSMALTGLPWLLLGHAMAPVPALAQLARWGGVGLLSAALAAANASLLLLWFPNARRAGAAAGAAVALLFVLAAAGQPEAGGSRLATAEPPATGVLRVALVQPAVPQTWREDPGRSEDIRRRLAELSAGAIPSDLVVWPENALTVLMPANADLVRRTLADWPRETGLLFGAPRYDPADPTRRYNSVFLTRPGVGLGVHRDKTHLVPFTESTPFGVTLSRSAALTPGAVPRSFKLGGERLGVLICYEMLFRDLVAGPVHDGAGMLFNLSNDGYFGGSSGEEQHLAAVVLAAVEMGRPVLRATLDGVTAAVDEGGRVVSRLEPGRPGVLRVDVRSVAQSTPAMWLAPWISGLALVGSFVGLVGEARRAA